MNYEATQKGSVNINGKKVSFKKGEVLSFPRNFDPKTFDDLFIPTKKTKEASKSEQPKTETKA